MKFLAMHITNQKWSFDIFTVRNSLNIFMEHDLNILMIFVIKEKCIILTHTVYCWILNIPVLWLLLCCRVTYVHLFFVNVFVLTLFGMCYVPISQKKLMSENVLTLGIIFFYYNSNSCIQYIINLFIILGNFFIHKCIFLGKNPLLSIFLVDYNSYILSLMGIKN